MNKNNADGLDNKIKAVLNLLQSGDLLDRNEGFSAAIQIGTDIVPDLIELTEKKNDFHSQVMYALAQIADPRAEKAFLKGLQNPDEYTRAYAAMGLFRMKHSSALEASLQTLNDAPDELHLDITPSVLSLSDMGLKAAPLLLELLLDEFEMTRLHSQRSLQLMLNQFHKFKPGLGFPTKDDEAKARKEWVDNGNYNYTDDETARILAVSKLKQAFGRLAKG